MKKNQLSLLLIFACIVLLPGIMIGQVITNTNALIKYSEEKATEYIQKRALAEEYAKLHDIPVTYENDNGVFFELQYISEEGIPMYYKTDNRNAAKTVSTDKVYSGGGAGLSLDGSGITVREWDGGGVLLSHQEFNGRVVQVDNPGSTHWHSTHVAGTIMASGVQQAAKGMAYDASLRAFDWNSDDSEMAAEGALGALISNHSYGFGRGWSWNGSWTWLGTPSVSTQEDYKFGFYDFEARGWDYIAANAPYYLIVKSAGNDRNEGPSSGQYPKDGPYDCIAHGGISKNVLTVGAVNDIPGGYSGPGSVNMSSFSCWGPADDGRVKPDLVANGVGLYSSTDASNSGYTSSDGTSMSAPSAAGSLALLQQHWEDLNGNDNYMTAATLKGLVLHTADEAGNHDGPDYQFGWGLMNTKKAALLISEDQNINVISEEILNNGSMMEMILTTDGSEDLKVTICWTDVPGSPTSAQLDPIDPMLVNDLDMIVTSEGNSYYPWKLNRDNPDAAATNNSENNVDNVEMIFIENASAGDYLVTIDHDGVLSGGNQAFSIIVSGVTSTVLMPVATAGEDSDVCENGVIQLEGSSSNSSSVLWTSLGDGIFDDPTLLNASYTPGSNDVTAGNIELKLTAYALPPLNDSVSDNMNLTIMHNPVSVAGEDITICETGFAQLDGQAENQESIEWTSTGDGTFDDPTLLSAIYTPGAVDIEAGVAQLKLKAFATTPCVESNIDIMDVNITKAPKANAGSDAETCGANTYMLLGVAQDFEYVEWSTSGDGTFNDISMLDAGYTPGTNDVAAGSVTLSLTAVALSGCPSDSTDNMVLTILPMPVVIAGDDASICENNSIELSGFVEDALSVMWTAAGDGTFDDASSLETFYTPGVNDVESGSAILKFTAYFSGSCDMGFDELQLTVIKNPSANAGSNDSVCKDGTYTLSGEALNVSSVEWTTSGDGVFTDVNLLNSDYVPGTNDISNGEVELNLAAYSVNPCSETANSTVILSVLDCSSIGENSFNQLGFIIIPNPADNRFEISAKDVSDNEVIVKIVSLDGRIIYQRDFSVDGRTFSASISSSEFATGIYNVIVSTKSKVGINKLIIQH